MSVVATDFKELTTVQGMLASFAKPTRIWRVLGQSQPLTAYDACLVLDLLQGQRVLEHIGSHILYDPVVIRSIKPLCGLCLRPPQLCRFYLAKGKGAKGNLRINQKASNGCLVKMNYSYSLAAESTATSPCSNVPIHCPICPKADTAIWKYSMRVHFEEKHTTLDLTKYEQLWKLSNFERSEMKKIWAKRGRVSVKRTKKIENCTFGYIRESSGTNSCDVCSFQFSEIED